MTFFFFHGRKKVTILFAKKTNEYILLNVLKKNA